MQNNTKLNGIKRNLPSGSLGILAQEAKLSRATVNRILDGKGGRLKNVVKVITAGEKIISDYKELTGNTEKL